MVREIIPFVSVGPLTFGSSINEAIAALNLRDYTTKESEMGTTIMSIKQGIGLLFKANKCVNVSCFFPSLPTFKGVNLLSLNYTELLENLKDDKVVYANDEHLFFPHYGLECIFSDEEEDVKPLSVQASVKGYRDNFLHFYDKTF